MASSRDGDTILAEIISDSLDLKEGVIHLAELPIGASVVGPCLRGLFHPVVTMLALATIILSGSEPMCERHTRALV